MAIQSSFQYNALLGRGGQQTILFPFNHIMLITIIYYRVIEPNNDCKVAFDSIILPFTCFNL